MSGESFHLFVLGRLHGVTRNRLTSLAAQAGGRLARTLSSRVDVVAVAHSTAATLLSGAPPLKVPNGVFGAARVISEETLKRRLGTAPSPTTGRKGFTEHELCRAGRVSPEIVQCLSLYDVLQPADGLYGYTDLLAAREVSRLLQSGFGLSEIVQAAIKLRRSGHDLADTRLSEAPWGELVQTVRGCLGTLEGQYALDLSEAYESPDAIFERAEECESEGDLESAERLYRILLRMEPTDPIIPFNLANVLDGQGRPAEAMLYYRHAVARDEAFAEAWLNLALIYESRGNPDEAVRCYRRAIQARKDYPEALYGLALLFTRRHNYEEAQPLWDSLTAGDVDAGFSNEARRFAMLCRVAQQDQPAKQRP